MLFENRILKPWSENNDFQTMAVEFSDRRLGVLDQLQPKANLPKLSFAVSFPD